MAATAIMTVRISPGLLAALKARAKDEGRSVSAEVVRMISKEIHAVPERRPKRTTMGMFPEFDAPTLDEFKRLRRCCHSISRKRGSSRSSIACAIPSTG